jgi:hypothetical protein
MPGGDFAFVIVVLVLGLAGAGELLIRAVERLIVKAGADPHAAAHGDVPAPVTDSVALLRDRGAL